MQRALAELERDGLLYTERTAGRFVSQDQARISKARGEMGEEYTGNYYSAMKKLGYKDEEILYIVTDKLKFKKEGDTNG
jgi:DNA-binding transcriptional regulator YhcF (GntR family)